MFAELLREATENPNDFNKAGKIPALEEAFGDDPVALAVSYMISTSHEYKKPNAKAALKFVRDYEWSESTEKVSNLQGMDKPVNKEKVFEIATTFKKDSKNKYPLIVVNKFHGVTPQTKGKKILMDGHHRKEGMLFAGIEETPVYYGKYIGHKRKDIEDIQPIQESFREDHWEPRKNKKENQIQEASSKITKESLTPEEREAVKEKYGSVGCSFHKNTENGKYFCMTHRARSKFYDSPVDMPVDEVRFISSTS